MAVAQTQALSIEQRRGSCFLREVQRRLPVCFCHIFSDHVTVTTRFQRLLLSIFHNRFLRFLSDKNLKNLL